MLADNLPFLVDVNPGRKHCKHVYEIRYRRRWPVLTCVRCEKEVR